VYSQILDELSDKELERLVDKMNLRIANGDCDMCKHISASISNVHCIECCIEGVKEEE